MTLSQIRTRINALKRRFARELAIINSAASPKPSATNGIPTAPPNPPMSSGASQMPASDSLPSPASAATSKTPDARANCPNPNPSSSSCCPGPRTAATGDSSSGSSRLCRFRPIIERL